jgi:TldD protein
LKVPCRLFLTAWLCWLLSPAAILSDSPRRSGDRLLDLATDELKKEMAALKKQDVAPYFIGYTITDGCYTGVGASFGALTGQYESKRRLLSVTVRVGDYEMDNTRPLRGGRSESWQSDRSRTEISTDDSEDAIRNALWRQTDLEYRKAVERYAKVKADASLRVEAEDKSPDFSREETAVEYVEPISTASRAAVDSAAWGRRVKQYSARFLENPHVYDAEAALVYTFSRKHLITTEGTRLVQNKAYALLSVSASVRAADGMELPLYLRYFAALPENLPADEAVEKDIDAMLRKLEALRTAPVVDPYTGPAILSGRAAAVFLHEVFGHRIEGHRQKSENEGQTFKKMIGKAVLPASLSVCFDPTRSEYYGKELMGAYRYDDEGIRGRPVQVIDKGILRSFLMSRSPIEGFPESNGHGRAQTGFRPVARQSNLILETSSPVTEQQMREELIRECRAQGKPFGLLFQDIEGGFTFTGRTLPNSFNVVPLEVYRIYADGRPDELVRGVDLVGTPLVMFSMIAQAGKDAEVFNGMCGAESGRVPVSSVSPALLIKQVEVQKKPKSQELRPILPRPDLDGEVQR